MADRPSETIKTLTDRGFGFIQPEGGGDNIFFHATALQGLVFEQLRVGQAVEFDVDPATQNPGRVRASRVRPPGSSH